MQGFGEIVPGNADSSRLTFHLPTSISISQFQSNETFLLKIASSLFEAAESGCVTVLVALAFDTIGHQVLVRILEHKFGLNRSLSLAKFYLEGRS